MHVLDNQPIIAAVSHYELAVHPVISLDTLRGCALISLPAARFCALDSMTSAWPQGRAADRASYPEALARLAAHGLGVAILPGAFAEVRSELLRSIAMKPVLRGRLVFAWRAGGPKRAAGRALSAAPAEGLREHHRLHGFTDRRRPSRPDRQNRRDCCRSTRYRPCPKSGCRNTPRSSLEPAATSENPTNNTSKSDTLLETACTVAVGNPNPRIRHTLFAGSFGQVGVRVVGQEACGLVVVDERVVDEPVDRAALAACGAPHRQQLRTGTAASILASA